MSPAATLRLLAKAKIKRRYVVGFKWTTNNMLNLKNWLSRIQHGVGLYLEGSETNVDVLKCVVKECGGTGMLWMMVPLLQQHNVNLWRMVVWGVLSWCKYKSKIERLHRCTTMEMMVCVHMMVLSWIFMVQKRTSIPTNVMVLLHPDRGKVNIHLPSQHNTSHDNVGEDRVKRVVVPSPTSTPTVHSPIVWLYMYL